MPILSTLPKQLNDLKNSNEYAASLVTKHPTRFCLLAALPTDNPGAALREIGRAVHKYSADGFAIICTYNGVSLGDPTLDIMWAELNRQHAIVFVHSDAYAPDMVSQDHLVHGANCGVPCSTEWDHGSR